MRFRFRDKPVDLHAQNLIEAEQARPTPEPAQVHHYGLKGLQIGLNRPTSLQEQVTKQYVDAMKGVTYHVDKPRNPEDGDMWTDENNQTWLMSGGQPLRYVSQNFGKIRQVP